MISKNKSSYFILLSTTKNMTHRSLRRCSIEEHVRYCIRAAILTKKNERFLVPELGSEILDLLYRPLLSPQKKEAIKRIRGAIERWEPRVEIVNLDICSNEKFSTNVCIELTYRILNSRKIEKLQLSVEP